MEVDPYKAPESTGESGAAGTRIRPAGLLASLVALPLLWILLSCLLFGRIHPVFLSTLLRLDVLASLLVGALAAAYALKPLQSFAAVHLVLSPLLTLAIVAGLLAFLASITRWLSL